MPHCPPARRRAASVFRRVLVAAVAVLTVLPVAAAPAAAASRRTRHRASSHSRGTRYVVVLNDDVDTDAVADAHTRRYGAHVVYHYRRAVHGYAAVLSRSAARSLAHEPGVASVEPDRRVRLRATRSATPWDLDRLDQPSLPLDGAYKPAGDGRGVTAYVIDTGIRTTHHVFGGRAVSGFDAVDGGPADDCNGHGTHVAGTIGGQGVGVAPAVRLVAVRVLDCHGQGTTAAVIAGIDWVTADHRPETPAVANLSLGGSPSAALDRAVRRSIADGVTFAVAAGNSGADACGESPARVPEAITVGATDASDHRPRWSNLGPCVDVYAPGARIRSAWKSGDTATKVLDGTSMASPHVAGAAALFLQGHPGAAPATVAAGLVATSAPTAVDLGGGRRGRLLQVR